MALPLIICNLSVASQGVVDSAVVVILKALIALTAKAWGAGTGEQSRTFYARVW